MLSLRSFAFAVAFYSLGPILALVVTPALLLPYRAVMACKQGWLTVIVWLVRHVIGVTHEIRGTAKIPPGPVIFAAKHQSAWDTIGLSYIHRTAAVVLKRELAWIPVWGWFLLRLGMIPIDRGKGPSALKHIVAAARRRTTEGRSVLIFPQGTRTAPGTRRPYLVGVAAIYAALDLPVVPVALNSGLFWPRRTFRKWPGAITVEYLEPIPPGLNRKEFLKILEDRIETATTALEVEAAAKYPYLPPLSVGRGPAGGGESAGGPGAGRRLIRPSGKV